MAVWRKALLGVLLLVAVSLFVGALLMVLHGLFIYRRGRGSHALCECIMQRTWLLAGASGLFLALLLTKAHSVPWDWLGTLVLLAATAPALLTWLGPPDEHIAVYRAWEIGKGSAYNHYFGYLRLMCKKHGIRKRLVDFQQSNPSGLTTSQLQNFYTDAVVALAPKDGEYPCDSFAELDGIGKKICNVPSFKCTVGGNQRDYGGFSVHPVTSESGETRHVALDRVGALGTLRKLRQYDSARFGKEVCQKQMQELLGELEKIVRESEHLRGQLKVVSYEQGQNVGEAIINAITRRNCSVQH